MKSRSQDQWDSLLLASSHTFLDQLCPKLLLSVPVESRGGFYWGSEMMGWGQGKERNSILAPEWTSLPALLLHWTKKTMIKVVLSFPYICTTDFSFGDHRVANSTENRAHLGLGTDHHTRSQTYSVAFSESLPCPWSLVFIIWEGWTRWFERFLPALIDNFMSYGSRLDCACIPSQTHVLSDLCHRSAAWRTLKDTGL